MAAAAVVVEIAGGVVAMEIAGGVVVVEIAGCQDLGEVVGKGVGEERGSQKILVEGIRP